MVLPRRVSPHAVGSIGHEFIGVVEEAGADVDTVAVGDLVVAPFIYSDMSCPHCLNGSTISCVQGGNFGNGTIDGGQGEAVRVPLAGSTLVPVPGSGHADETLRVAARPVRRHVDRPPRRGQRRRQARATRSPSSATAPSACPRCWPRTRLGAERIIALSRHADRQQLAREFGATDIVEDRGDEAERGRPAS